MTLGWKEHKAINDELCKASPSTELALAFSIPDRVKLKNWTHPRYTLCGEPLCSPSVIKILDSHPRPWVLLVSITRASITFN